MFDITAPVERNEIAVLQAMSVLHRKLAPTSMSAISRQAGIGRGQGSMDYRHEVIARLIIGGEIKQKLKHGGIDPHYTLTRAGWERLGFDELGLPLRRAG